MNPAQAPIPPDAVEEAIFNTVRELDRGVRAAFLDRVCPQDAALRERIESLLRADERADLYLNDDPLDLGLKRAEKEVTPDHTPPSDGNTIGRYKLLQKIGEGGMGVVYMAEQQEPVRRRVALKIIKLGMDTAAVVARFEAERQALALMDHPNIARILDGGASDTGRPYFVMELVHGVPITDYCDQNHLGISGRIELFLKVCDAVQSAHKKGIIHRDLKPSNIMVTLHDGVPVPKVIDFGVAKAMNQELTAKTLFTNYGTIIGTPAYMSPEQAEMSGLDVDTLSDIYSLGALLYELLTGSPPFPEQRLRSVGYGEMQKIILHEDPPRPSTRLAQTILADNNRASKGAHRLPHSSIDGDLDSIVMKCLEKDRTRRYETASALAADIRRHLRNEPVAARPPSTFYQVQKFVRRNRAGVAVTAAILLAICGSLIVAALSYRRERAARAFAEQSQQAEASQRRRAQTEAARAEAEALRAARFQYASDMNLAQQAVEEGNLFRALQLLNRHRPAPGSQSEDVRGWEWRYLWKKSRSEELLVLGSHSNGVATVGFSPDGKMAFSGGKDDILRLWNMTSMRQSDEWRFSDDVNGAAWSPDGRWLAVSTEERTKTPLFLIDFPSRRRVDGLVADQWLRQNSLAFSPDNRLLAFASHDTIYVWDIAGAKHIVELPSRTDWMTPIGIAFAPDGETLAYGATERGEIALWDIRQGKEIRRWRAHSWYVTRLFYTPDGQKLISASGDRTVKIWNIGSGELVKTISYPMGFGPAGISSPRLSRDGRMLASAASGGGVPISLQEIPGGREIRRLRGNTHMVQDFAFSPDGEKLISGSFDGTVRLWELSSRPDQNENRALSGLADFGNATRNPFCISPDARYVLTASTNNTFTVWELPSLKESDPAPIPVTNPVCMALSTGGETGAFIDRAGNVVFWDRGTGKTNWFGKTITNRVGRAAFSADGKRLVIGGAFEMAIYNLPSNTPRLFPTQNDGASMMSLEVSHDGQKIVTGYFNGFVTALDLTRPNPAQVFSGHHMQVNAVALLPDGETFVSAAREVLFGNLKDGTRRDALQPRPGLFRAVAVSPDGRRLAAGGADGVITIWDLVSKQEVATFPAHNRPLMALKFLSDGDTLMSLSVDEIRVWSAAALPEADRSL